MARSSIWKRMRAGAVPLCAGMALALAACGNGGSSSTAVASAPAAAAAPAAAPSPAIQKIYDTTCKSCHAVPASGAPQFGDAKAWAPRLAQGKDTLIQHAIDGFKGMPPMGMCPQCSEDDFAALISYMSGTQLK